MPTDDRDDRDERRDEDRRGRRERDDRDEGRPRRREREDDRDRDRDDRPARRRRLAREDDRRERQDTTSVTVLGVSSLVLGIIALLSSLIPCVGVFAVGEAALSLTLGIVGIVIGKKTDGASITLPITGTVVSSLAIVFCILWLLVISAFFKGVNDLGDEFAEQQRQHQQAQREEVRTGLALDVTAAQLYEAYDENTVSADAKYKGKVLKITGKVVRITEDGFRIRVELEGDEDDHARTVECNFQDEDRASLAVLQQKQIVQIRGRCRGKIGRSVFVEDCVLVP